MGVEKAAGREKSGLTAKTAGPAEQRANTRVGTSLEMCKALC